MARRADPPTDEKAALLAALLRDVEEALAVMEKAAQTAREAAAHPEMRPENDKDTRALEAGYLASGQSARAAELKRQVGELRALRPRAFSDRDRIEVLALVEVADEDGRLNRYFLAPTGGGKRLSTAAGSVTVLTAGSPLGDALLGRACGDVVEVVLAGKPRELEVIAVR